MARYLIDYDGTNTTIVATTDDNPNGMSFVAAKKVLLAWMRGKRDDWAEGVRRVAALAEQDVGMSDE